MEVSMNGVPKIDVFFWGKILWINRWFGGTPMTSETSTCVMSERPNYCLVFSLPWPWGCARHSTIGGDPNLRMSPQEHKNWTSHCLRHSHGPLRFIASILRCSIHFPFHLFWASWIGWRMRNAATICHPRLSVEDIWDVTWCIISWCNMV